MTRPIFLGVLLCLAGAGVALADPPSAPHPLLRFLRTAGTVCPPIACCPNDYCRKPMPPVWPIAFGCCVNDYCRKPFPCVVLPDCFGPDDYCRKPLPCLLCPPNSPYLRCAPGDCAAPR